MNIKDVNEVPESQNYLEDIWQKQKELANKYKDIEKMPDFPFDIDDHVAQSWIKDFCWRVTEELAEALESLELRDDPEHFYEELSDALHFLVEIYVLIDLSISDDVSLENLVDQLNKSHSKPSLNSLEFGSRISVDTSERLFVDITKNLGLAANTLKNKKWKQTQVETDYKKFKNYLHQAFVALIDLFVVWGFDAKGIYALYFRKHQVNKFRQQTNY